MPSRATTTAPILPLIDRADLHHDARDLVTQAAAWLEGHWLQILIAAAIGAGIYLALRAARHLGAHLCERDESGTGWPAIIGRGRGDQQRRAGDHRALRGGGRGARLPDAGEADWNAIDIRGGAGYADASFSSVTLNLFQGPA